MNRQQKIALGVAVYAASRGKTGIGLMAKVIGILATAFLMCFLLGAGIVLCQGLSTSHPATARTK